jgi:hypothetical protein
MKQKEKAPRQRNLINERQDKDKKNFVILLNRDSGFHEVTKAPLEPVPFGYHCLPYEGDRKQMQRICRRLNRKPAVLSRKHLIL